MKDGQIISHFVCGLKKKMPEEIINCLLWLGVIERECWILEIRNASQSQQSIHVEVEQTTM